MKKDVEKIVLTVCKGNIHRSVIAAACIEKLLRERNPEALIGVQSRGLQGSFGTAPPRFVSIREYSDVWAMTRPGLDPLGIEIPANQAATPIRNKDVENAILILAMDRSVRQALINHFGNVVPELQSKLMLFMELAGKSSDVPDPVGEKDPVVFQDVANMIYSTVDEHLNELIRLVNRS
jgi:protein-tyrosine-phosphatase